MNIFIARMCRHHMSEWCLWMSEENSRCPGTRVLDNDEPPCVY